jgi:hypothetical protein
MKKPTNEEIRKAIQTIIDAGRESYIDEVKETIDIGKAFGMGVSRVNNDVYFLMEAAAEHAEDWNFHGEAAEIRKMIPKY